jgi:hypothetical protein
VIDSIRLFEDTHPAVMNELVSHENWDHNIDVRKKTFKNLKYRFLYYLEKMTGWRPFEYRNYRKI